MLSDEDSNVVCKRKDGCNRTNFSKSINSNNLMENSLHLLQISERNRSNILLKIHGMEEMREGN